MTVRTSDELAPGDLLALWVALPATPAAAGLARRFLARSLPSERPDVLDVAVLLASELVANAVLHGLEPIRLQLHVRAATLRVEVHDAGLPFDARAPGAWSMTDEHGRGLGLVSALASSWGSGSDGSAGKVLWFELGRVEREATAPAA